MGLLAVMRSLSLELKNIGCMITASHNPECDNGCKLVDPLGDMMEEKWEAYATQLVNSKLVPLVIIYTSLTNNSPFPPFKSDLKKTLTEFAQNELKQFIDAYDTENSKSSDFKANVVVAHDTRASCAVLLDAFQCGVADLNGNLINYGLLTTPQLHYMVRCRNTDSAYGRPDEKGYCQKLATAFNNIWSLVRNRLLSSFLVSFFLNYLKNGFGQIDFSAGSKYEKDLFVDGANGIGADKIEVFNEVMKADFVARTNNNVSKDTKNQLNISVFNAHKESDDILNHKVRREL